MQQFPNTDFLFQVAGKTGNGMLQAVCAAKAAGKDIWGIGVDVDQYLSTPGFRARASSPAPRRSSRTPSPS